VGVWHQGVRIYAAARAFRALASHRAPDEWWPEAWEEEGWPHAFDRTEYDVLHAFYLEGEEVPDDLDDALFAAEYWWERVGPGMDDEDESPFSYLEHRDRDWDPQDEEFSARVDTGGAGEHREIRAAVVGASRPGVILGWVNVVRAEKFGGEPGWYVYSSWLTPKLRRTGTGGALYRSVISEIARQGGGKLMSGQSVKVEGSSTSESAARVWEGLCREFGCPPGEQVIEIPPGNR